MNISGKIKKPIDSSVYVKQRSFPTTFLSQVLQLGILGFLVWALNIESDLGFVQFFPLLFLTFIVHALSAPAHRPKVFLGSFVLTLYLFLGGWDATVLLALGMAIFGACHLPVALGWRKLLVLGIGVLLALGKTGLIWFPLSSHGLTIIAAIFMFRVIVYLHELQHQKEHASIWHRLNYFFLLPNIIFPLFPIVDYQEYLRTYYDRQDTDIYQRGINLIVWSVVCLLIYRWLYYFAVPDVTAIIGAEDVALYTVATYLTVIRLIGLFSLSVGILRLFGYNLPDIFNYMFFASSFLDLFRRVNIYWKNFLMKICFYPFYMRIRKAAPEYALALAMLFTFFFTWVFHIYQWAWVLGTNPIRDTSLLFWGSFGILATVNSLYEEKKKRPPATLGGAIVHAAKVVGVFLTMAVLYTMWTHSSFLSWLSLVQVGLQDDPGSWLKILTIIAAVILTGGALYHLYLSNSKKIEPLFSATAQRPVFSYLSLAVIGILFVGFSKNEVADEKMAVFIENYELNTNDASQEYDGYYEDILKANISSKLWDDDIDQSLNDRNWQDLLVVRVANAAWSGVKEENREGVVASKTLQREDVEEVEEIKKRPTNDVLIKEYLPNQKGLVKGKRFSTNQWGLRDRPYEKMPPAHAFRIAVMGSSPTLGSGVHDEEVFEQLVEKRLNEEYGSDTLTFELINFARSGKRLYQNAYMLEQVVKPFQPDLVVLFEHFEIKGKAIVNLRKVIDGDGELYPELKEFINRTGINLEHRTTPAEEMEQARMLMKWSYPHFYAVAERCEIPVVMVYFPGLIKFANHYDELKPELLSAGFEFIDMKDVFDGYSKKNLQVSDQDRHPNALAHRLVADRFFAELVTYLKLEKK